MMHLVLVGTSHHHAPVELRERVALGKDDAHVLAAELGEAVVLSTCNRTELYVAAADADEAEARAAAEDTDAGLSPIAVCARTFRPACSACRKTRSSSGPGVPFSCARRT